MHAIDAGQSTGTLTKRCPTCGETKPLTQEYFPGVQNGHVIGYCRPCWAEYTRDWKREHPRANRPDRRRCPDDEPRARQILSLIAEGRSDLEIACALRISYRTIRAYLERHYRRTGATSRTAAVVAWLLSDDCTEAQRERLRSVLRVRSAPASGAA